MRLLCCLLTIATWGAAQANPGAIDAQIAKAATSAKGVIKLKLYAAADGTLRKIALYHTDATQVPERVKAKAKATFGDAPVKYYESEVYADLGRIFEVEVTTKDGEKELAAKADGTVVYVEAPMKPDALPAAVLTAAKAAVPGAKVIEAEHKKGPKVDEYAVKFDAAGVIHYVRLSPDGKVINHGLRFPAEVEVLLE